MVVFTIVSGFATDIGHPGSPGNIYRWTPTLGLSDPTSPTPSAQPTQTTTYTCIYTGENGNFGCGSYTVTVYVIEGVEILLNNSTPCDGESVRFELRPVPSSLKKESLDQLFITLSSKTQSPFNGNPSNTDNLSITNLGNYAYRIENALWYSSQNDHCNDDGIWDIEVKAVFGGVNLTDKAVLFVNATDKCLFSEAIANSYFTGEPEFEIEAVAGSSNTYRFIRALQGSLIRDIDVEIVGINEIEENSQYKSMILAEEQFHVGQLQGTTSNILDDLWRPENLISAFNTQFSGQSLNASSLGAAKIQIKSVFDKFTTIFLNADTDIAKDRRCCVEYEAKNASGASYRLKMECAYANTCPIIPPICD